MSFTKYQDKDRDDLNAGRRLKYHTPDIKKDFENSFKGYHKDAPSHLRKESADLKKKTVAKKMSKVSEFNRDADSRFNKNLSEHEFGKGGLPFRPMYVFKREKTGEDYKRGYVVSDGKSHKFFLKKSEAEKYLRNK